MVERDGPAPTGTCCFSRSRQHRSWALLRPGREGTTRGSATERHGLYHPLPRRSPPTPPYLCFSSALCTDLRKTPR